MTFLRSLLTKKNGPPQPSIPPGHRIYAIGDVHGRLDLLDDCLQRIERDIAERGPAKNIIVFLGDLIDRGPSSAQVVERVRTLSMPVSRTIYLVGNHEEVLLRILRGEAAFRGKWLRFGGAECVRSYGIDPTAFERLGAEQAVTLLKESIPQEHQRFLASFVDTFRIGSYLFVHAGVRPGVPLADQSQTDLRWIREPFLHDETDHGFVVIHGHTISEEAEIRENRIGVDTGAYKSGILTTLALERSERWFLQSKIAEIRERRASPALPAMVVDENMNQ